MAYTQNEVIVPVVNWNGTSAEGLIEGYMAFMDDLRDAIGSLKAITPHGRDFQTEHPDVYREARNQHRSRVLILEAMLQETENMALAVQDQQRK